MHRHSAGRMSAVRGGAKPCSAPRCSRQTRVQVVAFRATVDELSTVSKTFPQPFCPPSAGPSIAPLARSLVFHPSLWYHDHQEAAAQNLTASTLQGSEAYQRAVAAFQQAYVSDSARPVHISAVAEGERDLFFWFSCRVINSGSYCDKPATYSGSNVHGMYHLHLNEEGKVETAWCFRAPTAEERACLLKPPLPSELVWPSILRLRPATWPCDDAYTSRVRQAAHDWAHEVQGKGCTEALQRLAHEDITVYEGAGLHSADPMDTVCAVEGDMLVRRHTWDLGKLELVAMAAQDNRAFIHWKQPVTHRKQGGTSHIEGTTMLVFDEQAKVVQVLDYSTPTKQDREQLFHPRCESMQKHMAMAGSGAVQGGLSPEAVQAMARQEQEWMSW